MENILHNHQLTCQQCASGSDDAQGQFLRSTFTISHLIHLFYTLELNPWVVFVPYSTDSKASAQVCEYHAVLTVHKKNWDPLVFGPALAIDRMPGPVCFRVKFSSANLVP